MSFKQEHENCKGYESDEFYVKELPDGFSSALQGFIARHCEDANELKDVINDIAGIIPTELTTNWGWSFLIDDLPDYVNKLCQCPLPKTMDFLADLFTKSHFSFSADDINELLEDLGVGYELIIDKWAGASWQLRDNVSSRADAIEDTVANVKDICSQTLDHLIQAREHLLNTKNDRDRKDAIRDCLSAMESMLKTLSGKADIKDATAALRSTSTWGPDIIVKDGLSLWDRMHNLYPDIRHGNPDMSLLSDEEALYWLERITCFIRYIARVHNKNEQA
jgi:hypothetical protein